MSLHDFINMGGYGGYIWPCYAVTLLVLGGIAWSSRRQVTVEQTRALRRSKANQE